MEPKLFNVRVDRDNLNSIVVEYLKEAILSGTYNEGDRIVETEVADHLGVSRAPIREAIRELEKEALLKQSRLIHCHKIRPGRYQRKYIVFAGKQHQQDFDYEDRLGDMILQFDKYGERNGGGGRRRDDFRSRKYCG